MVILWYDTIWGRCMHAGIYTWKDAEDEWNTPFGTINRLR